MSLRRPVRLLLVPSHQMMSWRFLLSMSVSLKISQGISRAWAPNVNRLAPPQTLILCATLTYSGMPIRILNGKVNPSDMLKYSEGFASGMAWRITAGTAM